jgi:hypothetical protein
MEIPGASSETAIQDVVSMHIRANGIFHRPAHKSNTAMQHYHPIGIGPFVHPSKLNIPPDQRWRVPMKNLILAAFAALSLSAAIAPLANAATFNSTQTVQHQGPYDNTANSLNRNSVGDL